MPGLTVPMEPICDATFLAQMKRLPVDWKQPQGNPDSGQYRDAFPASEHMSVPQPGCYFWTQSTNKYHTETCKNLGDTFKTFCHDMLGGFKQAVDIWRVQAKFQNLIINGPTATGTPGCLSGPSLESYIKNFSRPAAMSHDKKWRDAVAKGLAQNFKQWQDGVSIPGLPFYPAFAAFPSPMAPPMPNVPFPLIACPSPGMAQMSPMPLKQAIIGSANLGKDMDGQFDALATAIGTAVSTAFMAWLPMQLINNVLGKGPIPTFAPPFVPVGPVVMGDNIPMPGHLAT